MRPVRDFQLEIFMSQYEFSIRHFLCGSDAQTMTLRELLALATDQELEQWDRLELNYSETRGAPALRQAIAETCYTRRSAEDVLCFAGAEEGIYCAMRALLGPQDHAVVFCPNYQSLEALPAALCAVSGLRMREEDDWNIDLDALESLLRPNTRLIVMNYPHNPTGKVLPQDQFEAIVAMAAKRGIYIYCDEVYRGLERERPAPPPMADFYERGISLGVLSKSYGLAGLRLGWTACQDRELLRSMDRVKHYLSICNPTPSEFLGRIALRNSETILAKNQKIIADNLALLDAFFKTHEELFDWKRPDGATIGFPKYHGPEGVDAFVERLITEAGVLLLPARVYDGELYPAPRNHFRIGFGRSNFKPGLEALDAYLKK